jgi:type IVB pilus formation R64 PilN family outer membrane protein
MSPIIRNVAVVTGIVASLSILGGCTGVLTGLNHDIQQDTAHADHLLGGLAHGNPSVRDPDAVVVRDQLWLSGTAVRIAPKALLPKVFDEPASFDGTVDTLRGFAERVTRLTHIIAKVSQSAEDAAAQTTSMSAGGPPGNGATASSYAGVPPLPPGMATGLNAGPLQGVRGAVVDARPVRIIYSGGTLRGLLDAASARFGVYWKYNEGAILFFHTDTRVFQVSALPGDSKLDTTVVSGSSNTGGISGSSGGGGGTGGGSSGSASGAPSVSLDNTTNTNMNAQLSVYGGLQAAIRSMLSPAGSVVPSPATGSISVTDTPDVLDRVGSFIDQQNRVLSRQILVNVTVLSVTLSAEDSYGINWGAVYQALGTQFDIKNTFAGAATGGTTFAAAVITPSSRASGTTAMITALSQQGRVRRKTSASVTTLNDQPVPVQVATQQSYLAQVSTTNTVNVGSQTAITPGTFSTGFNLTLLPHILDDGSVMMQFYTNISSLKSLVTVPAGNASIQVPTIDSRNFLQRVSIKSGQTLVISGYEGIVDDGQQQGVGTPHNILFGGGYDAQRAREVIVILLTPVTMSGA